MGDGIGGTKPAGGGGGDLARAVDRIAAAVRNDDRMAGRQQWLGRVGDALREAQPLIDNLTDAAVDPIALGEAREQIAAMLAEVDALAAGVSGRRAGLAERLDGMVPTPIPLAPGADRDAVAAARAVAQLIAANARPAISTQARIGPAGVRSVLGE